MRQSANAATGVTKCIRLQGWMPNYQLSPLQFDLLASPVTVDEESLSNLRSIRNLDKA
jgi:hypothetical protein